MKLAEGWEKKLPVFPTGQADRDAQCRADGDERDCEAWCRSCLAARPI